MKVFLSHSFSNEDRELVGGLERLLSSQDIALDKGRRLGGEQLRPEIWRRIEDSNGLIALMTRRKRVGDPGEDRWRTSTWIDDEYKHAREHGKQAIAMVEHGVEIDGAFENYEHIQFDRSDLLEAFLALSETLWQWKERIGVLRVVQIRPDELGRVFGTNSDMKCRYRFIREGVYGQWIETKPVRAGRGTLLYVRGVPDDDAFIEVQVLENQSLRWFSQAASQYISVEMEESP